MSIVRIDASRITEVEQFWQRSRHLYRNIGYEDLPALLNHQIALLGEDHGHIWGFLCVQSERRPTTLPATAANRAYIRAVALAHGRSPIQDVPALIARAATFLPEYAPEHWLTVYGDHDWLNRALGYADFTVEEKIQFLELSRLQHWHPSTYVNRRVHQSIHQHPALEVRPCHADDLALLADLDAHAFTPLWHFGVDGLRELLFTGRFQVATIKGLPVGYTAISYHNERSHLTRLAVHPRWQGHGLGHLLLLDALQDAQDSGIRTVMLNTQVNNHRARKLYYAHGFRATGQIVPVLGTKIRSKPGAQSNSQKLE